jgi:ABC-2 type transport system permease protein
MDHSVAAVWSHHGVLRTLVRRDLTLKYQQSVLGYLWSLIDLLTMAIIYWFIFGLLFDTQLVGGGSYPMFIISGIFAWARFNSAFNDSTGALTSQSGLVTTINLPRVMVCTALGCALVAVMGWWAFRKLEPSVLKEL